MTKKATQDLLQKRLHDFSVEIKKVDEESNEITAIVSDESVDRYGDIILQDGWDFTDFEKNPIIFANHSYDVEKIVGKAVSWEVKEKKLFMTIRFNVETQLGKDVFSMFKNGFLNAFSVGFMPLEAGYEKREGKDIFVIRKAQLLEVSAVGIPANPNALKLALRKGVISAESETEMRGFMGKEFELKEKEAELDLKLKIFAENHEIMKGYRTLLKTAIKLLGIDPSADELAQIKKLQDNISVLSNSPQEVKSVVKTSPQSAVDVKPISKAEAKAFLLK